MEGKEAAGGSLITSPFRTIAVNRDNDLAWLQRRSFMIDEIFGLSSDIRYVAVYKNGELRMKSRTDNANASSSESDRYEELLVNPTLLTLTTQRGRIDCGGLDYLLVRYGNFFQFVLPKKWGHVSVCIETEADPIKIGDAVKKSIEVVG